MGQIICITAFGLIIILAGLHVTYSSRFRHVSKALISTINSAPSAVGVATGLPDIVSAFAQRAGVRQDMLARSVYLVQHAEIRMRRGGEWQPLKARQSISIAQAGFAWEAQQFVGPFTKIRILDAYSNGEGQLQARFLGSIPLANETGQELNRSELMRYLAELPWAPDAILGNLALQWTVLNPGKVEVSLEHPDGRVSVNLLFDSAGDIVEMQAKYRPVRESDGTVVLRDWRGLFSRYGQLGNRRIPRKGEVGYLYDGVYEAYWRGDILDYVPNY
ncbi:DUF6544 family protein [Profundibacter amoris]|uniref:Uncharacterized protein n=1 Tax=Profundibacter amoris TaxID=2171755 RepID=A0A347UIS1_9RHOB|nr:DUF6544 family protein [Profundibacter amoris]AXX98749.1 hypothetical protein BAR1_12955 [Profundibacter amoris]